MSHCQRKLKQTELGVCTGSELRTQMCGFYFCVFVCVRYHLQHTELCLLLVTWERKSFTLKDALGMERE